MFSLSHVTVHQLPYLWAIVLLSIAAGAGLAVLWWRHNGGRIVEHPRSGAAPEDREEHA